MNRGDRLRSWLRTLAPGMLVAATGVGAGDLLTASVAGSRVGVAIVWAAVLGGLLKWTLNEGIARWQLATDTTVLEGWLTRLPRVVPIVFMAYFWLWTVMVGGALVNACGVAGAALLPMGDPAQSKIMWGIVHSIAGYLVVRRGGFNAFEQAMAFCTALLFGGVPVTAVLLQPDWAAVLQGLFTPSVPPAGLPWTLAVLGGVGGTVTLLAYGYWIRETGRTGAHALRTCRVDLGVAYALTAVFGVSMISIGSRIVVEGQGVGVAPALADQLGLALGPVGRWLFLLGFWGAVFSSLLGVWQSAPYLFADFVALTWKNRTREDEARSPGSSRAYRGYLAFVTLASLPLLWGSVTQVQLMYSVLGAMFMPFLALTLLVMNNRAAWVGSAFRNSWWLNVLLAVTVLLFIYMGMLQLTSRMPAFGS